jgi:hypothetical protein
VLTAVWLQVRQGGTRVDLAGGNSLSCYRRVAVESLLADQKQGVFFEISFDEPDLLRRKSTRDKVSSRCRVRPRPDIDKVI